MTKKTAIQVLKIAVSLGLYILIFWKVGIADLWNELKSAKLPYFIAGVLIYYVIQGFSAYRWYLMLKPLEIKTRYSRLLSYYFLGMFFNFLMPTAIGGDVFRVYYLNKETRRLSASTASVFIDRDIGMAGLVLVAAVVATYAGIAVGGVPLGPVFWLILAAFLIANLALFYRPTYNVLHKLLAFFRMKRADERVEHLFRSFNAFRGQWSVLTKALLLSIAVQIGCAFVNLLAAYSIDMNTHNGWLDYLIFIPTIGLITMAPISVNGMGLREGAYIMLFTQVIEGTNPEAAEHKAAALAFLWLGITVLTSLPGGIIYAMRGGRKSDDLASDKLLETQVLESTTKGGAEFAAVPGSPREKEPANTI